MKSAFAKNVYSVLVQDEVGLSLGKGSKQPTRIGEGVKNIMNGGKGQI